MSVTIVRQGVSQYPTYGDKVRIYWNLHNKMYSVVFKGRVVSHTTDINLKDVTFVVRQSGRERVLRENKKNVHAYVVGKIVDDREIWFSQGTYDTIAYNPYKTDTFRNVTRDEPIFKAEIVALSSIGHKPDRKPKMQLIKGE